MAETPTMEARTCDECGAWTRHCAAYWDSIASFRWVCEKCWQTVIDRDGPSAHD